jgi:hypothetical protein
MHIRKRLRLPATLIAIALVSSWVAAQTQGQKEDFTAVAIANDELGSGAGIVQIQITRWSTAAETTKFVTILREKGSSALLDLLRDSKSVGTIRTPDSLGYDLRYAQQTPGDEGGRDIVIATDRPIGFWESWNRPRSVDYPFTVIQMQIGANGKGKGTMSYAAKIRAYGKRIELENFSTSPVMLTQIDARKR